MILANLDSRFLMNDAQWERMVRQSVRRASARIRTVCRTGEPLPFEIVFDSAVPAGIHIASKTRVFRVNAQGMQDDSELALMVPSSPADWFSRVETFQLDLGRNRLRFEIDANYVRLSGDCWVTNSDADAGPLRPSARRRLRERAATGAAAGEVDWQTEVKSAGEHDRASTLRFVTMSDVEIIPSDSDADLIPLRGEHVRATVFAAFRAERMRVEVSMGSNRGPSVPYMCPIVFRKPAPDPPLPVAFELFLEQNGALYERGTLTVGEIFRDPIQIFGLRAPPDDLNAAAYLILRPSAQLARKAIDREFVDEEFRFGPFDLSLPEHYP